jgi:hypothetical protein
LHNGDDPDPFNLQERKGAARDEHTYLVAEVEDYVGVVVDEVVLLLRVQVDDLLCAGDGEGGRDRVLQEVDQRQIGHCKANLTEDSLEVLPGEASVVRDSLLLKFFF